jgi:hypothetical protein
MAYMWLAIHDVACIAGGVYLVSNDSPWWGALCFLLVATATVKEVRTKA